MRLYNYCSYPTNLEVHKQFLYINFKNITMQIILKFTVINQKYKTKNTIGIITPITVNHAPRPVIPFLPLSTNNPVTANIANATA